MAQPGQLSPPTGGASGPAGEASNRGTVSRSSMGGRSKKASREKRLTARLVRPRPPRPALSEMRRTSLNEEGRLQVLHEVGKGEVVPRPAIDLELELIPRDTSVSSVSQVYSGSARATSSRMWGHTYRSSSISRMIPTR